MPALCARGWVDAGGQGWGGEGVFIFGQAAPVTHKNHDFFRKSKKNKNLL